VTHDDPTAPYNRQDRKAERLRAPARTMEYFDGFLNVI